jgi:hypothetical protein
MIKLFFFILSVYLISVQSGQAQNIKFPVYSLDNITWDMEVETQKDGSRFVKYFGQIYAGCSGSCMPQGYYIRLDRDCNLLGFWDGEEQVKCDPPGESGLGDLGDFATFLGVKEKAYSEPMLQRLGFTDEGIKALKKLQTDLKTMDDEKLKNLGLTKDIILYDEKNKQPNWNSFDVTKLADILGHNSFKHHPLQPQELARLVEYANNAKQIKELYSLIPDPNGNTEDPTHGYAARMSQAMRSKGPQERKENISGAGNSVTTFFVHLSMIREKLGCDEGKFPRYKGPKLTAQPK